MKTQPRSLERSRTQEALAVVREATGRLDIAKADLKACLEGLPVELRTRGVALTVAALQHRKAAEPRAIAEWIAKWLMADCPAAPLAPVGTLPPTVDGLLRRLETIDAAQWAAATTEAIAFVGQAKVFAGAFAEVQP